MLSAQEVSVFSEISKPVYGVPKKVSVESLGISANVIPVGVDASGRLETPKKWDEVGGIQRFQTFQREFIIERTL